MLSNPQVEALVSRFVRDLEAHFRSHALESAHEALRQALDGSLGGSAPSAPRPRKSSAAPTAPAVKPSTATITSSKARQSAPTRRFRRSPADIDRTAGRILEYVRQHPGTKAEELKAALKVPKNEWSLPVNKLIASGALVTSGQRRATTYDLPGASAPAEAKRTVPPPAVTVEAPKGGGAVPPIKRVRK